MILERRSLIRSLGAAAVVVAADYLLVLTDCIIAGRVIGEAALGAMNLLMPAFSVVTFFTWLLGSGMSATYLRAVHKGDGRHAAEIAWQGMVSACVLALVLGILVWVCGHPYLSFMGPDEEVAGFAVRYGRKNLIKWSGNPREKTRNYLWSWDFTYIQTRSGRLRL